MTQIIVSINKCGQLRWAGDVIRINTADPTETLTFIKLHGELHVRNTKLRQLNGGDEVETYSLYKWH
jgi:hypothetical protein